MTPLPSTERPESPRRQSRWPSVRRPSVRRPNPDRSLADDRRGVTELLGLILAFTLVVSLVVLLQVSAVPSWNKAVEYDHSQRVQQDFDDFSAATTRVAASGVGETVALEPGVEYPSRFLLVNPPPASGTLRATGSGTVSFSNLEFADENAQSYWTTAPAADRPDLTARALVYEPGYQEYRDAGSVVYEAGIQYRSFPTGALVDRVVLVDGDRLSLVLLEGDLATSGVDAKTLDLVPISAPARSVTVTDTPTNGDNIFVRVPSQLPAPDWRDWLAADGELEADGGRVVDVHQDGPDAVRLELVEGEYELRIVKLGLDGSAAPPTARYLAAVSPTSVSVDAGERVTLAVEARDQYNNPVSGVPVEFTGLGPGADAQVETDAQGRATYSFVPSKGTHTVDADIDADGGGETYESVSFTVGAGDSQYNALLDPTQSSVDVGKMLNPAADDVYIYDWAEVTKDKQGTVEIAIEFRMNPGQPAPDVSKARINFVSNNGPGASKSGTPLDAKLHTDEYPIGVGGEYYANEDGTPLIEPPNSNPIETSVKVIGERTGKNKYEWESGDFLILSFEFEHDDGRTAYGTYLIAPYVPSPSDSDGDSTGPL